MPRRPGRILLLSLVLAAPLGAEGVPGPARQLFDAYLAEAARSVTAYRAEIRIGDDPKDAGPGRLSGESAYLGRFTYRPVTYAELSRAERARLVHDPQFRAFLERQGRPAAPASPPAEFQVSLSPEEMLRSAPFVVVLPEVNPPADLPEALDPEKLAAVLAAVHAQVAAALWLSAGMILAFAAIGCIALACRRSALACGFGYSLTLCFLTNGHAQLLGPAGCAVALAGFLWPRRRPADLDPRARP